MQITDEMAIRCICAVHDEIARGDIGPDFSPTVWPGDFDDPDEYLRLTKVGLTAALAAAQPVADAEVDKALNILSEWEDVANDAGAYPDAADAEWLAERFAALHARAVRAEAERDEARGRLSAANRWPDPLTSPVADAIRAGHVDDTDILSQFDKMAREIEIHRAGNATGALADARALLAEAKEALKPFAADQLPDNSRYSLKARISRDGTLVALTDMEAAREHARATLTRLDAALTGDAP